jgi:hypothetical protein
MTDFSQRGQSPADTDRRGPVLRKETIEDLKPSDESAADLKAGTQRGGHKSTIA